MHIIKMIFCIALIALCAGGSNPVFSQNELVLPPEDQRIERELVFDQQITTGNNIQRTISRDGSMLAIVNSNKLQVWDLIEKRMIAEQAFNSYGSSPISCSFSASGQQVLICTNIGVITVYDLTTRDWSQTWTNVTCASQNLNYVAVDNGIYINIFAVDHPENIIARAYSHHNNDVTFSNNEQYLLMADYESGRTTVTDLLKGETTFDDTIAWQSGLQLATISNNGKRIAGGLRNSSDLIVATVYTRDSAVVSSAQLAEHPQSARRYGFTNKGRYLCVGSTRSSFRVYDCDDDFKIVYEDITVSDLSDKMFIDSTFIYYSDKETNAKIVLDQRSLQVIDTLAYPESLSLFAPDNRPTATFNRRGATTFFYNEIKGGLDTLQRDVLQSHDHFFCDPIRSNLLTVGIGNRYFPLDGFDLRHLEPMNIQDSLSAHDHSEIKSDAPYWHRKENFSPLWKYNIDNAAIFSWADGRRIMELPFLKTKVQGWQIVYTYQEDRVMFFNSDARRIIVADLTTEQLILDKQYPFPIKHVQLSPTGGFLVLADRYTSSLQVEWLEEQTLDFGYGQVYEKFATIRNIQISPNGQWLQIYASTGYEKLATIWSMETGELLYQSEESLVLIDHPTDVLQWSQDPWSTDSLRRISIASGEVRWSIPFEGEYLELQVPVGANYYTYIKDGVYHGFADLSTGQELWQMGKDTYGRYFVKSSQYPIVKTNHAAFLENFHYEDQATKETVYPAPETLPDTSNYLQKLTRKVLGIE